MQNRAPSQKRHSSRGPVRPVDCAEFNTFWRAVEVDQSVSGEELLAMFRDLGVYGRLTELATVAKNLLEVLGLLAARAEWQPYLPLVERWPSLLQWILRQESVLPPSKYNAQRANKNPLVNVCATSHPLYTLLWTSSDPNQLAEFRLLQGHALIAHLRKARQHAKYEYDYLHSVRAPYEEIIAATYRSSIALREISETFSAVRPENLRPDRAPEEFAEDMLQFWEFLQGRKKMSSVSPAVTEDEQAVAKQNQELAMRIIGLREPASRMHLQGFCYVLAEAFDLRKRQLRSTPRGKAETKRTIQGYLPLMNPMGEEREKPDWDDPAKRPLVLRRRVESAVGLGRGRRSARKFEWEYDIDEAENSGEEVLEPEISCVGTGKFPALNTLALRGKAQAEALQNQLLPWEYNVLTDTALRSLVTHMREDFERELQEESKRLPRKAKIIALLKVLLWTGCGLEVARKLQVRGAAGPPGLEMLALEDNSETGQRLWNLRIPPLSYGTAGTLNPAIVADTSGMILRLPDIAHGSDYLLRLRERFPVFRERGFYDSVAEYQKLIRQYLREVDPSGYLTLAKVEDYLWSRLAQVGDPAEADLLVGKRHYLASVRRFYTTLAKADLQQRYCDVVESIQTSLGLVVDRADVNDENSGYAGAVYRPTLTAVQSAVMHLRDQLTELAQRWPSIHLLRRTQQEILQREYYNRYTLYTWFFFSYATAARATCHTLPTGPIPDLREGLISYADKTTQDRSHVRLVWLPAALTRQLVMQRELAFAFRDLSANRNGEEEGDSNFLLLPRSLQMLCPKVIAPYLAECFGQALPVNSHRRFCRSYLLEEGCHPEVIDAFLGHWFTGESPWSRYSSLSVSVYIQELQPYLLRMLSLLGLEFVPWASSNTNG